MIEGLGEMSLGGASDARGALYDSLCAHLALCKTDVCDDLDLVTIKKARAKRPDDQPSASSYLILADQPHS